jgi:type II secretory pathway pseudopilin PulG
LLELLVVIVILGILGAVVIINTRAVGDRGRAASCAYDRKVLTVAQEAVWAKTQAYTTEGGLVAAGFLESQSQYWDVALTAPTAYSLTPQAGSPCP